MVMVVPLTTHRNQPWQAANQVLYPILVSGTAGIAVDSIVLLDQAQAIDASRVGSIVGTLTPIEYIPVERGLRQLCDL